MRVYINTFIYLFIGLITLGLKMLGGGKERELFHSCVSYLPEFRGRRTKWLQTDFLLRHTMHSVVIDFPGQGISALWFARKPPTDQTPLLGL